MIHWIAGKKRGVGVERAEGEGETRLERSCRRHLPLRGWREVDDSKVG